MQDIVIANGVTGLGVYDCASNSWKMAPIKSDASANPLGWNTATNSTPLLYDSMRDVIFAITYENRVYAMRYIDSTTTVAAQKNEQLAFPNENLILTPNPFNPVISIISTKGETGVLFIHDVSGRLVAQFPFNRKLNWNSLDNQGKKLPTGLYLVSLKTKSTLIRSKAILAR
jgi:hypothetical protein